MTLHHGAIDKFPIRRLVGFEVLFDSHQGGIHAYTHTNSGVYGWKYQSKMPLPMCSPGKATRSGQGVY
jgi:hypothetical protein